MVVHTLSVNLFLILQWSFAGSENSEAPPLPPAIPKRDGNKIEENTELIEQGLW